MRISTDSTGNKIVNSIIWGGIGPGTNNLTLSGTSSVDISYSIIEDTDDDVGQQYTFDNVLYDGTAVDPSFVNAGAGDFHLNSGSPCIDSADGTLAPATDLDGNSRNDDAGSSNDGIGPPWADMGVFEY